MSDLFASSLHDEAAFAALSAAARPSWIGHLEEALRATSWERILWSVGIVAAALLIGRGAAFILHFLALRWSRLTATPVDDVIVKHVASPLRWLLPLLTVALALPALELKASADDVLRQIVVVAIILNIGWLFFRVIRVLEEVIGQKLTEHGAIRPEARGNYTQLQGFRNIAGFLIALISIGLALLSFAGVRQIGASMLASAGVAGVVLGFAAQRSIATVVSGLVLAVAQPIRIEDVVVVEGENGTVEEITLTYVIVRLWDRRRMVLPVNYFLERPFQNWSRGSPEMLASIFLSLDYSVPVEELRNELRRVLETSQHWDRREWALNVTDATDKCVVLRAQMSAADTSAAFALRCEVREKLIGFVREKYPHALPKSRNAAEAQEAAAERKA